MQESIVKRRLSGSDAAWLVTSFWPCIVNEEQERFVKNLDRDVMSTWAVMYCGGTKSVICGEYPLITKLTYMLIHSHGVVLDTTSEGPHSLFVQIET